MSAAQKKPYSLKIYQRAFFKLLTLRDYKKDEVAMYGISHSDDLLTVVDFELAKQKVNTVSADIDVDWVPSFEYEMIDKHDIDPIRCTRIWAHTHPMTGENSADPSGKDMNTWKDPDNAEKNFFVMLIVSRSGQITCKLRVLQGLDPNLNISGLSSLVFEKDIDVEIIDNPADDMQDLKDLWGIGASRLTITQMFNLLSQEDKFKLFPGLEEQYDELVSPDIYSVVSHSHDYYPNSSGVKYVGNQTKLTELNFLKALGEVSFRAKSFSDLSDLELSELNRKYKYDKGDLQRFDRMIVKLNPSMSSFLGAIICVYNCINENGTLNLPNGNKADSFKFGNICQESGMTPFQTSRMIHNALGL